MPHRIIENMCVRVTTKGQNLGSGVLMASNQSFYVLTACHCLGDSRPPIEEIIIEKQDDYRSEFGKIKVVNISEFDAENDVALIEVDFDGEEEAFLKYRIGKNFLPEDSVRFCGYQNISKDRYRPFNARVNVVSTDKSKFQITLKEDSFDQGGEDGQFVARGLSGSGVFIIKNKMPYLIGILNSVKTDKAWNDDIDCNSIICIENYIREFEDLSDIENLKKWNENLEKERTERDLEAFKSQHSNFFNFLDEKNRVIYDSVEKANEVTVKQVYKYLSLRENVSELENRYPNLYVQFKEVVKKYRDQVEDDYSGSVENSRKAREIKTALQNELKHELERFIPSVINIDLSEYQIIEWLGICTLKFVKK